MECEQILTEQNLDVRKNAQHLSLIRSGIMPEIGRISVSDFDKIKNWYDSKEKHLAELYQKTELPNSRDKELEELLRSCLEIQFGKNFVYPEIPFI